MNREQIMKTVFRVKKCLAGLAGKKKQMPSMPAMAGTAKNQSVKKAPEKVLF